MSGINVLAIRVLIGLPLLCLPGMVSRAQGPVGNGAATADLDVQPIIYGPTMPDANTVGLCIYLGARKQGSSGPQKTYNWVQRVSDSDETEHIVEQETSNSASADKRSCVYPQDEKGYFGKDSYFIDNCTMTQKPTIQDPSFEANSDFYRNGNAHFFTGAQNPSWIDLKDSKPFDYVFVDIPNRTISKIDRVSDGKDSNESACGESDPSSIMSSILGGLSQLTGSRKLRWCAVLTPVLVGTECAAGNQVTSRNGIALNHPYCKLSPQPLVRYGFTVSRISVPLASNPQGAYYKMVLDPLLINGRTVAPSRTYIMNFIEVSNNHYTHKLYNNLSIYNLPMTVDDKGEPDQICTSSYVKGAQRNMNHPLPTEPMKFRQPFTP